MPNGSPSKGFLFGIILLIGLVVGIPLILSQSQVRQIFTGNAWNRSQYVKAACDPSTYNASINVSFTNKESDRSMLVNAVDKQSGKSIDLGKIEPGKTKTGNIYTGRDFLDNGFVTFKFSWEDRSRSDSSDVGYSRVSKCRTYPSPSSAGTPSASTSGTPNTSVTPSTSVTPTYPPYGSITPSPTTCPTPGTVKNIKVQCPYCTPSPNTYQ